MSAEATTQRPATAALLAVHQPAARCYDGSPHTAGCLLLDGHPDYVRALFAARTTTEADDVVASWTAPRRRTT